MANGAGHRQRSSAQLPGLRTVRAGRTREACFRDKLRGCRAAGASRDYPTPPHLGGQPLSQGRERSTRPRRRCQRALIGTGPTVCPGAPGNLGPWSWGGFRDKAQEAAIAAVRARASRLRDPDFDLAPDASGLEIIGSGKQGAGDGPATPLVGIPTDAKPTESELGPGRQAPATSTPPSQDPAPWNTKVRAASPMRWARAGARPSSRAALDGPP